MLTCAMRMAVSASEGEHRPTKMGNDMPKMGKDTVKMAKTC